MKFTTRDGTQLEGRAAHAGRGQCAVSAESGTLAALSDSWVCRSEHRACHLGADELVGIAQVRRSFQNLLDYDALAKSRNSARTLLERRRQNGGEDSEGEGAAKGRLAQLRKRVKLGEGAPLTTSEVAMLCGYEARTIHEWATSGRIPFFRTPGQHLRFRPPDVRALLSTLPATRGRARQSRVILVLCREPVRSRLETRLTQGADFHSDPYEALLRMGQLSVGTVIVQISALGVLSPLLFAKTVAAELPRLRLILVGAVSGSLPSGVQVVADPRALSEAL